MAATTTCPFECGWDSDEATTEEEGRAALCAHLVVEHSARPKRDEEAWDLEEPAMQAGLETTPEEWEKEQRESRMDLGGPEE